jgi:hypothetical protein
MRPFNANRGRASRFLPSAKARELELANADLARQDARMDERRQRAQMWIAAGTVLGGMGAIAAIDGFFFAARIEDLHGTAQFLERWCGLAALALGAAIAALGALKARR